MSLLLMAYIGGGSLMTDSETETRLAAIAQQCRINQVYYLRAGPNRTVTIHVRPEVRALPLKYSQMDCVAAGLRRIGLRLAPLPSLPKPATAADLESHLMQIHYFCDLGPYELKAGSATMAYITIPPTMRVRPLSRAKYRCVKAQVERIRGVRLGPGIVPTVD